MHNLEKYKRIQKQVDAFEIAMNRTAENAEGETKDVFWGKTNPPGISCNYYDLKL